MHHAGACGRSCTKRKPGVERISSHASSRRAIFRAVLFTCQAGFENLLVRELGTAGYKVIETGVGWMMVEGHRELSRDFSRLCFPHAAVFALEEVVGGGVNALAGAIADLFFDTAHNERFMQGWPMMFSAVPGKDGLGRRVAAVRSEAAARIKKRMSRVARIAGSETPTAGNARGLFVVFVDFDRAIVSRDAWFGGQCRMADDPVAPSRSYLKVEEAYRVLGDEPGKGETVVDLGAAPGGWSFSAAKRGARVLAIDNGPLKAGAAANDLIEHRREDAFRFEPNQGDVFDWLFCDLVEEPHHVLRAIAERWIATRWCRKFVVNLKFGRADALALLAEARKQLEPHCDRLVIRHLFHDREEFTLVGVTRSA